MVTAHIEGVIATLRSPAAVESEVAELSGSTPPDASVRPLCPPTTTDLSTTWRPSCSSESMRMGTWRAPADGLQLFAIEVVVGWARRCVGRGPHCWCGAPPLVRAVRTRVAAGCERGGGAAGKGLPSGLARRRRPGPTVLAARPGGENMSFGPSGPQAKRAALTVRTTSEPTRGKGTADHHREGECREDSGADVSRYGPWPVGLGNTSGRWMGVRS